jgi:valyl-tRNA synthetase
MLRLASDGRRHGEIARLLPHVEALAKMEAVELVESLPSEQQAVSTVVADVEIQLPIAGLIDLAKERDRLGKERDGLAQRVAGVDKKLANANFTERAPAEVVDRERQRRAELAESLEKLEAQLRSLG